MFETSNLAALHKQELRQDRPPLCPTLFRAYTGAGIKRPSSWKRDAKWESRYVRQFRNSTPYQKFLEVFQLFVRQVVVPLLGCGELMYQCPPTLRCQMPSPVRENAILGITYLISDTWYLVFGTRHLIFTGCRLCRRPLRFDDSRHRDIRGGWEGPPSPEASRISLVIVQWCTCAGLFP